MFDYVVRKSLKNHKGIKYTYDEKLNFHNGKEECEITKIIYADDIIIVSQSEEEVKKSLENLDNITKNCGMKSPFFSTKTTYSCRSNSFNFSIGTR